MTLYTTDYLEYYLTLVGWLINNGIWNILVASGMFALPFVVAAAGIAVDRLRAAPKPAQKQAQQPEQAEARPPGRAQRSAS